MRCRMVSLSRIRYMVIRFWAATHSAPISPPKIAIGMNTKTSTTFHRFWPAVVRQ